MPKAVHTYTQIPVDNYWSALPRLRPSSLPVPRSRSIRPTPRSSPTDPHVHLHLENAALAANPESDHRPASAACMALCRSAEMLIGTMPISLAGLQALERHLSDDEVGRLARIHVVMPTGLGGWWSTYDDGAVTWLCDRHAARLAG